MSTAQECFERAELALYRAETLVGAAVSTLECAKAQAQGSIAIGWARLGDALANEPRELDTEQVAKAHVHDNNCYHAWVRPMEPCANGCGAQPLDDDQRVPTHCPETCPDVNA